MHMKNSLENNDLLGNNCLGTEGNTNFMAKRSTENICGHEALCGKGLRLHAALIENLHGHCVRKRRAIFSCGM